jgi:serine/threonine protein kinase/WD40 repeat protein
MTETHSGPDLLNDLAHEFAERFRRGERPTLTEYTDRYPDLADQIRDLFPALVVMEQFGSVAGPPSEATPGPQIPPQLGEYRILREVGRGGMGIVYEAVQESLGRHVALKVLPFHGLISPTHLERFEREAKAVARLHHTNIVPVFGIGVHAGVHYYAMQFIQGQGLDTVLNEVRRLRGETAAARGQAVTVSLARGLLTGQLDSPEPGAACPAGLEGAVKPSATPIPSVAGDHTSELTGPSEAQYFRGVARLGVQVAEALAYAHRQGIVHRDIKPSNLLLDTQGVVWVTDFGLVKDESGDQLTQTGDIVGTVRYMAPERFDGRGDGRSDLYSLGATLYELLALCPAFADVNRGRLVQRVLHEEPLLLRKLDPRIPRDLETIIVKAMAKDPALRYQTAGELAEDLRRFLADRPVRARRSSMAEQTWRWCRRNPVVAGLLTAVAGLLVVIAVVSSVMAWRLNREHKDAVASWHIALDKEREAKDELWQSLLSQARAARFGRQAGRRFDGLKALAEAAQRARELKVSGDRLLALRNEAIACMALTDVQSVRRLEDLAWPQLGTGYEPQLAFDNRWEFYARGDPQGNVSVRRLADDREITRFSQPSQVAPILLFSPDGRYLAAKWFRAHTEQPLEYVVWEWRQDKQVLRRAWELGGAPLADFAFTQDSRQVILGGRRGGSLGFYDLDSGREVRSLDIGRDKLETIALHPDGRQLALNQGGNVVIRSLDSGAVLASWKEVGAWGLAWHPEGKLLAAAGVSRVHLLDLTSGQQRILPTGDPDRIARVEFNHAGTLLASWGWSGVTRLWDPQSGKELVAAHGHCLDFSPDDQSLVYRSHRSSDDVGIWEVAHERVYRTLQGGPEVAHDLQLSSDGRLLASATDGGVRLWDAGTAQPIGDLPLGRTVSALFHPADGSLITSGDSGLFRWPLRPVGGEPGRQLHLGPPQALPVPVSGRLERMAFDRHGEHLAVVDLWQKVIVLHDPHPVPSGFNPDTRRPTLLLGHDHVLNIALSPDGRWAATGTFKGTDVKVWDLSQGERPEPVHTIPSGWAGVAFSPDGRWLVVKEDGSRYYRVGSWELDHELPAKEKGTAGLAFAPDGRVLAAHFQHDWQVGLIDPESAQELATLAADNALKVETTTFSVDGGQLAVATNTGAIQLWDLRAVRRQLADLDLDWDRPPYPPPAEDTVRNAVTLEVEGPLPGAAPGLRPNRPSETLLARQALYSLAMAMTPYHPEPYHRLGHVYEEMGQPQQAIADFTAALAWQGPDRPDFLSHLYSVRGASYWRLKEYERAIDDQRRALDLDPANLEACNRAAWQYVAGPEQLRDPKQALPLAQRAAAARPDNEAYLNTLGVVYYRLGEHERAVVALERSLRASQQAAGFSWLFLAMCHGRLGDQAQAQDCYNRAVRWMEGQRETLPPFAKEEFTAFRTEAEELMAKPK